MKAPKDFELLDLPKKAMQGAGTRYRVVKPDGTALEVEASTVPEAIQKSGVTDPVKVHRILLSGINVLDAAKLAMIQAPQVDAMQQVVEAAPAAT
ncbi:MAG: hypothetical protein AB7L92_07570 [Alphaproteobacteria bacterium]